MDAGIGVAGVGLEVLSMVIDPIGTVASYGVSWLIEHVQPLKEALDWFAGDPPVIRSVFTLGLATPVIAAQASSAIAKVVNKIRPTILPPGCGGGRRRRRR